jgi:PAS domain S-box-containing protein
VSPPAILVVEDNAMTRKVVRRALEDDDLTVLEAPDGRTALEIAARKVPDLILLDLVLPDADGFALVERLRALPGGASVPILAFTAFSAGIEDAAHIAAGGFTGIVVKPVDPSLLVETIRAHLAPEGAAALATGRRVLVVGDDPIQRKLVRLHLVGMGFEVTEAPDGRSALESARTAIPDAVLSDVLMPGLDGFGLCRAIREDPALGRVPVVLASSRYLEEEDRRLAREVGASAFVTRTRGLHEVVEALRACLEGPPPPLPRGARAPEPAGHFHRVLRQLDRQVGMYTPLARRYSHKAAELAVLSAISDALTAHTDLDAALDEVVTSLLDAGAISLGALYRMQGSGAMDARAYGGYVRVSTEELRSFFGHPELMERILEAGLPALIPSPEVPAEAAGDFLRRAGIASALVLPLRWREERLGALLFASRSMDLGEGEWPAFARTVASQIAQALALARAFSEKDRAEEIAREHAAVLRSILDSMADGVIVAQSGGKFLLWNQAAERILRMGPTDRPPQEWSTHYGIYRPDRVTRFPADELPLVRAMRGEVVDRVELFLRHEQAPEGVWLSVSARPLVDPDGTLRGGVSVLRDVTAEKAAQEALARAQRDFRQVIEKAPDAMAIRRGESLVYANPAFAACLGYASPEDLVGKRIVDLFHPEERARALARFRESVEGHGPGEVRLLHRDGTVVTLELSADQLIEFEGEPAHFLVGRDVTERKKMQAQLLMSDRMVTVGMLAAGVAHEINNPLASLMANLILVAEKVSDLSRELEGFGELEEMLRDARVAADRIRQIVRDLRIFSRSEEERRLPLDVRAVLASSIRMARNEIRHRARVVLDYGAVPLVEANESRLGQVFLNLLVNAAQAIPEGAADRNEIRVTTRTDASGRAVVEVADTGAGISPEVRRHLFTPFFTTKPAAVGTGLGLSICHRIVTALGGEIAVESEVGQGTIFRVTLPPAGAGAAEAEPEPLVFEASRRARVLVVDDEPMVGRVASRILANEHEVRTTTTARAALDWIAAGERFDVILCDLMMPVVTGMDFYEELRRLAPDQAERVIFLTGGAFTPRARTFLDEVPNPRLDKPFDPQGLRSLVNARLR